MGLSENGSGFPKKLKRVGKKIHSPLGRQSFVENKSFLMPLPTSIFNRAHRYNECYILLMKWGFCNESFVELWKCLKLFQQVSALPTRQLNLYSFPKILAISQDWISREHLIFESTWKCVTWSLVPHKILRTLAVSCKRWNMRHKFDYVIISWFIFNSFGKDPSYKLKLKYRLSRR